MFCSIIALAIAFLAIAPRSYTSEATMLMRVGVRALHWIRLRPRARPLCCRKRKQMRSIQCSAYCPAETCLNASSKKSVQYLNPEPFSTKAASGSSSKVTFTNPLNWVRDLAHILKLSEPGTKIDQAVRCLESKAKVESPRQTTLISIEYCANSPELARDVVDAMIKVFLMEYANLAIWSAL